MDFESSRAPRLVVAVFCLRIDPRSDVGGAVVIIVPEQVAGEAHFPRRMPVRFVGQIRPPHEGGEVLQTNAHLVEHVLQARRDFANDGCGIADFGRMIHRLLENFEVPIVKIDAGAIGRLRRPGIGEDEVAGDRDDLFLDRCELYFLRGDQVLAAFPFRLRIEKADRFQEAGGIEIRDGEAREIDQGAVLPLVAFHAVLRFRAPAGFGAIPFREIDRDEVAIVREALGAQNSR